MKRRILAILLALSMVMTATVYAEEETSDSEQVSDTAGEEDSGEAEDSGETHDSEESGETHDSEESGESHDSGESGESYDAGESGESYDADDSGESYDTGESGESYDSGEQGEVQDPGFEASDDYTDPAYTDQGQDVYDGYTDPSYDDAQIEDGIVEEAQEGVAEEEVPVAEEEVLPELAEPEFDILDHYGLVAANAPLPTIDNGGWKDYPASYEYNYDNTDSATKWGMWGGNGNLQGYVADSVNDLNVRHRMQMYCDGENIHLMITYASAYYNPGNGNDYMFYLDGEPVKFQVTYEDTGYDLTFPRDPGTYALRVTHENSRESSHEALGSYGTMIVHEGQLNNVTEICIPVSEMAKQNPNINPEHFAKIEFFTHNLMYRHIGAAGASSGPVPFVLITFTFFGLAYYRLVYRKGSFVPEVVYA